MEQENKDTPTTVETNAQKMPADVETMAQQSAPVPAEEETKSTPELSGLGKFKTVDALARAYKELEAEFTRRSQKLKALEESAPQSGNAGEAAHAPRDEETLYREVSENEGVRARILSDYLSSLKGVPLMTGGGVGVTAPANKPKSFREAGSLALGYLKKQMK